MKAYDYLDFHGLHQPDAEFVECLGRRLNYRETSETAERVAHALIAAGLEPGDRLAIISKNCIEMVMLFLGAFKVGVVPTPINVRLSGVEWLEICQDAEAKMLFCDAQTAVEVDALREKLPTVRKFVIEHGPREGWTDFTEWLAHRSEAVPKVVVTEACDALHVYTSGTTGKPKGVLINHRALTSCVAQLGLVLQFQPEDRFLLVMPLFHAAGIIAMLHALSGGASLLLHRRFDAADVVEALDSEAVTVAMFVPTMIHKCLIEVAQVAQREFEALRLIVYGASPISEETLREAMRVFGCDFAQRYGSTETLCLAWLTPAEHRLALTAKPELLHSAGRPLPGVQIRVVDADLNLQPPGECGEFVASSPALMSGYWKSRDAACIELDGQDWLPTGDAGYQDDDGFLYLCDRVHDVIISGGEKIYPHQVEKVLLDHPDVEEAVVIGVPHAKWGEELKALVVARRSAILSSEQLISYCRERLASFKTPKTIDMVAALPRDPSGKVLRREIRRPYWQGHSRQI